MNDNYIKRLISVLEEIRDNQKLQPERQAESLSLQREQFVLVQKQYDRAERLQDCAEEIQTKGAQLVSGARKALAIVIPIIIVLIVYLS